MKFLSQNFLFLLCLLTLAACGVTGEALKDDPYKFRFENYWTAEAMQRDLELIFPPGTPKSKVDEILVEGEEAQIIENTTTAYGKPLKRPIKVISVYRKETFKKNLRLAMSLMPFSDWIVTVQYDQKNQVINIYAS